MMKFEVYAQVMTELGQMFIKVGHRVETQASAMRAALRLPNATYIKRQHAAHPVWAHPKCPIEIRASVRPEPEVAAHE